MLGQDHHKLLNLRLRLLLLQIDMLGFIDESGDYPTLVVGGGIESEWLASPMKVNGLSFPFGEVNWRWDTEFLRVEIRGERIPVIAGPRFPSETSVLVDYIAS